MQGKMQILCWIHLPGCQKRHKIGAANVLPCSFWKEVDLGGTDHVITAPKRSLIALMQQDEVLVHWVPQIPA